MKNLLLLLLFVLPTALFSSSPSCLAGMEVSLIDANGKVVKTGKLNKRGQLTLDGVDDAVYTIRLSKDGKSCDLDKSTTGSFRGLPTGKRQHKPLTFKLSDQNGGGNLIMTKDAASGLPTGKRQHKPVKVTKEIDKSSTKSASSSNDGVDDDCDDVEFSVSVSGGGGGAGKVTIKDIMVSK